MPKAEIKEIFDINRDALWKVITDYERYAGFIDGCRSAKIKQKDGAASVAVYDISMIRDISYTLKHVEDPSAFTMRWTMVESDFLKKNDGQWVLREVGPAKTEVSYQVDVEFGIPVPGFMLSRLIKSSLPALVKSFVTQAKKT